MTTNVVAASAGVSSRVAAVALVITAAGAAGVALGVTGSPLLLIATVVAALTLLLVLQPTIGTVVFLALLWMNVPGVLTRFHGVPEIAASLTAFLVLVPVVRHIMRRDEIVVTPALFAILFFFAAHLLSGAASTNPQVSLESTLSLLGEGVLIYILVSNAIRTPRMAKVAVWVIVLASVTMAGLSLHQELTESYRDPYLGFAQTTRQEDPVTFRPDPDSRPRMMGPIGEQNRYAQTLLVALPLALFGLTIRHRVWGVVIPLVSGTLIVGGVFLTFSRGAAVALGLLLIVLVVRRYVRLTHMLAIVAAFAVTVALIAPEFVARIDSIRGVSGLVSETGGEDPDGAILGRATSNIAALLVFLDYPIVGVGPGVYADDYSVEYANQLGLRHFGTTRRAHNMYAEWAADLGIVGLTAGLAMLGVTFVGLGRAREFWRSRRPDYAALAGALWLALFAYAATAIFLHLSYVRYFFVLLAVANAVIWVLERERRALPSIVLAQKSAPLGDEWPNRRAPLNDRANRFGAGF